MSTYLFKIYLIHIYKELTAARHHLIICKDSIVKFPSLPCEGVLWFPLNRGGNGGTGRLRNVTPKSPGQEAGESDSGYLSQLPSSLPVLLPRKASCGQWLWQQSWRSWMKVEGRGRQESRLKEGVKEVCGNIRTGPTLSEQPTGGWGSTELQVQGLAHSFKASALLLVCLVAKSDLLIKDSIHSSICTSIHLCICSVSHSTNIYWMWIAARIFAKCQGENIAINHRLYTNLRFNNNKLKLKESQLKKPSE